MARRLRRSREGTCAGGKRCSRISCPSDSDVEGSERITDAAAEEEEEKTSMAGSPASVPMFIGILMEACADAQ